MFGYDFMVDDNFNVWLIEVNSSPSMDYSTVNIIFIFPERKETSRVHFRELLPRF